jgi:integrase/recombinase XerD
MGSGWDEVERDITAIRMPRWGRVVGTEGVVPWLVVDPDGLPVEPIRRYLRDFTARNRPGSVRSYAYGLLRWVAVAARRRSRMGQSCHG